MKFHPKALLPTVVFFAAVAVAVDFRLGLTTCVIAGAAYAAIEVLGSGFGPGAFRRSR
jgi:hypothetical protein